MALKLFAFRLEDRHAKLLVKEAKRRKISQSQVIRNLIENL